MVLLSPVLASIVVCNINNTFDCVCVIYCQFGGHYKELLLLSGPHADVFIVGEINT